MVRGLLPANGMLRCLALGSIVIAAACTIRGSAVDLATGDPTDPITVSRDCRGAPKDALRLQDIAVEGAMLRLTVRHGGGCEQHAFAACWDGFFDDSLPGRAALVIHHDANDDFCDALITRDVLIDPAELAKVGFEVGSAEIVDPAGTIVLVGR